MIEPFVATENLDRLLHVIIESFMTVAVEFNLTKANAPTNPAFMTPDGLKKTLENSVEFFVALKDGEYVGCVGIQPGKKEGEYYIERLAVLPPHRHQGIGKALLDRAISEIRIRKATQVSIGIINENTVLKNWYLKNGFTEYGTRKFDHLPFTVCFMGIP